ncbi:Microsomal glutathione S-transferase 3 [Entomortierella lignicola]|nr:Microsomal glutathione S-transferase 3 [Entomortierella lignicola]
MSAITILPEFGYTVAVAVASILLVSFFGVRVTSQRKIANVPLPFEYADPEECKDDHQKYIFNCYQRVHQNTLEGFSSYLVTLLLAGLNYPIPAAVLGSVWILGRIFYFYGYTTGNPGSRQMGAFGHIGGIGLLGLSIRFSYDLIVSGQ